MITHWIWLKHFVGLRIRRSTCKALPHPWLVTQRLPRPSAYQQVKLRRSWSPGLWKTSSVGTDASGGAGWLDRPAQHPSESTCSKVISVCRETFQASIFSAYAPLSWRPSTWHPTADHRASRGLPQGRSFPDVYIAYFVQPRPPLSLRLYATAALHDAARNVGSIHHKHHGRPASASLPSRKLAHPDSLTPASIGTEISPQPFEIG